MERKWNPENQHLGGKTTVFRPDVLAKGGFRREGNVCIHSLILSCEIVIIFSIL